MSTLADINKNLDDNEKLLGDISENTSRTSRAIDRFVAFMEGKEYDDLENRREAGKKKAAEAAEPRRSSRGSESRSGSGRPGLFDNLDTRSVLTGAALAPLATNLMGGLLRRGLPAAVAITFADEIGNYIESATGKAELGAAAERATIGGAFGSILGKRFALLGTILGAFATPDNLERIEGIGENLQTKFEEFNLKFPVMGDLFEKMQTMVGNGLDGILALTAGDFDGFIENFGESAALIGAMGLLIAPGPFLRMIKGLAGMARGPLGKRLIPIAAAVAAGTFVYDKFFGEGDGPGTDDIAGGAAIAAGTAATAYAGAKMIQSRRGPTPDEIAEQRARNSRMPKLPKVVGTVGGQNVVRSAAGNLTIQGADGRATTQIVQDADLDKPRWWKRFPRLARFAAFPGSGILFAAMDAVGAAQIMADPQATDKQKAEEIGGLIGGVLGAGGFAKLGAILGGAAGTAGFPGVGTLLGGAAGSALLGTAGYFFGNSMGRDLMSWFMGTGDGTENAGKRGDRRNRRGGSVSATTMDESYNPPPAPKVIKPDVASQSAAIDAYAGSNSAIMRNGMAGGMAVGQIGDNTSIINDTTPILPSLNSDVFDTNGMLWSP